MGMITAPKKDALARPSTDWGRNLWLPWPYSGCHSDFQVMPEAVAHLLSRGHREEAEKRTMGCGNFGHSRPREPP